MIEDALKSTRNLHRLIIGVSLAVLVFSLSMYLAEDKVRQKAEIDYLIDVDFLAYETWLQNTLDAEVRKRLIPAVKPLRDMLENSNHLVFELDSIADVLEQFAHIGRFELSESILSDMSAASLNALDALNGLSLAQDVQITVPLVDTLIPQLEEFLNQESGAGKRIVNARTSVSDEIPLLVTFLPEAASLASIDFELVDVSAAAATPVFQGLYEFELLTLPNTSFISWLQAQGHDLYIRTSSGAMEFLPKLKPLPTGFTEQPLGELSLRLADEIKAAGPEQRNLKILGTEVPGRLLIFAAPLILIALLYYFKSHLSHVTHMAKNHAEEMVGFSWLPINNSVWQIPGTTLKWSGHFAEVVLTIGVLPVGALIVMSLRLGLFGAIGPATAILVVMSCAFATAICWLSLRDIVTLRTYLFSGDELRE